MRKLILLVKLKYGRDAEIVYFTLLHFFQPPFSWERENTSPGLCGVSPSGLRLWESHWIRREAMSSRWWRIRWWSCVERSHCWFLLDMSPVEERNSCCIKRTWEVSKEFGVCFLQCHVMKSILTNKNYCILCFFKDFYTKSKNHKIKKDPLMNILEFFPESLHPQPWRLPIALFSAQSAACWRITGDDSNSSF